METDRAKLRLVRAGTTPAAFDRLPVDQRGQVPAPFSVDNPLRFNAVRLLSLDAHGRVLDWMSWQDAACLYARGAVAWTLGDPCLTVHGGLCRATGTQSTLDLHPIIAARGHARPHALDAAPGL